MATRFLVMDGKIVKDTRTGMPVALTDNIFTSVTYEVLKTMRDNGHLLSGEQYRIVDFVTTTTQENTQSAGHPFDIIVVADSANTLNENARAVAHAGDTYFANCKLSAWEIKYSLDNDKSRFWWADETNGKGVIYYMKDEYGNECHYDFKNIQFDREGTYYYTFSWVDENNAVEDLSIVGNTELYNDEGQIVGCYGNKMGVVASFNVGIYVDNPTNLANVLNDNVLISTYSYEGGVFYGCYSNTFGIGCYSNTFGGNCHSNTFGIGCHSNTFDDDCVNNTFGDSCSDNTFGDGCSSNTFGIGCTSNTLGSLCSNNTFLNGCGSNTFGDSCGSNTLNACARVTFGYFCTHNTVDAGVSFVSPQPTTGTQAMRGVHIHYGVTGQFTVTRGANYTQDVRTSNDVTITV